MGDYEYHAEFLGEVWAELAFETRFKYLSLPGLGKSSFQLFLQILQLPYTQGS